MRRHSQISDRTIVLHAGVILVSWSLLLAGVLLILLGRTDPGGTLLAAGIVWLALIRRSCRRWLPYPSTREYGAMLLTLASVGLVVVLVHRHTIGLIG